MYPLRPRLLPVGLLLLGACVAALFASGCAFWPGPRTHRSSSIVAYLYPKDSHPVVQPAVPELHLPLRVGIAFVPEGGPPGGAQRHSPSRGGSFTDLQRHQLAGRIADQFRALPIVESIETIPASYLRAEGGFENLDQVRGLLGIDVIVLVGYDQTQFTEQNIYSLSYWTIVGAYFFNGNRNDTHTLMEAAVYDIASRTLLFRSPGANQTRAATGAAYLDRELRADSARSLHAATADLVGNLQTGLDAFKQRVKEGKSDAKIVHRPGFAGGGAFSPTVGCTLLALLVAALSLTIGRAKAMAPACAPARSGILRPYHPRSRL